MSDLHLRGMDKGQSLKTVYNEETKEHTLVIDSAGGYEDKVLLYKYLHLEGDQNIVDAVGDYSDGELGKKAFIIKPKPGEIMMIARMIVSYKDQGSFDSGSYGNGIVLINGITSYFRRNGVDVYPGLDPNLPITKNPDWAGLCFDSRVDPYGSGEEQMSVRFTFTKTGKYIRLDGDLGDEYVLYFNDNLTGLITHRFLMQGYYEIGPII